MTWRHLAWCLGLAAMASGSVQAQSAPTAVTSESTITLDGGAFHHETFVLPRVTGDWFATAGDAHASIELLTAAGGHPVELDLQWDGPQAGHVITGGSNSDMGGRATCYLKMTGAAPYNLSAQPHDTDAITITVAAIDALTIKASIAGTVTGDAKIAVTGTIAIHRNAAPAPVLTGGSADCDRVVHDKLVGAQNRSPSECEVRFDALVRQAEHTAFAGVIAALAEEHWVVRTETAVAPTQGVGRHTQERLYSPDTYDLSLALDPKSDAAQAYAKRWNELSDRAGQEAQATGKMDGPAFAAFTKLNAEQASATNISVSVHVNALSYEFVSFVAAHTVLQVPGAAYALASSQVQSASGGGPESAVPLKTFIYLGKWAPATFEKSSSGSERARTKSTADPAAPVLSVQAFVIAIECNAALRDAVLQHMDFAPLRSLLPR